MRTHSNGPGYCLRPCRQLTLASLLLIGIITHAHRLPAEIIGFSYSGIVTSLSPSNAQPFGLSMPTGSAVTGQFFYDTTSTSQIGGAGDLLYRQSITDGFTATVAGIPVSASDYYVVVSDRNAPDLQDFISVKFSTFGSSPLPADRFFVNGVNQTVGTYYIKIAGGIDLFSSTDLPTAATLLTMTPGTSFLTSTSPATGARFSLGPLQQIAVPEPSSLFMVIPGIAAVAWFARRRFRLQG